MPTSEEQFFHQIMAYSKVRMPYEDFEDRTMIRIRKERNSKKSIIKDRNLALLFFILGTGFGLFTADMLKDPQDTIIDLPVGNVLLCFELIFVVFVLAQSDKLIMLFFKSKNL